MLNYHCFKIDGKHCCRKCASWFQITVFNAKIHVGFFVVMFVTVSKAENSWEVTPKHFGLCMKTEPLCYFCRAVCLFWGFCAILKTDASALRNPNLNFCPPDLVAIHVSIILTLPALIWHCVDIAASLTMLSIYRTCSCMGTLNKMCSYFNCGSKILPSFSDLQRKIK